MQERTRFKDSSTLSETLDNGNQKTITRTNLSLLEYIKESDIIINGSNILFDYMDEIDQITYDYTMKTDEIDRYYMRPDLFAYDKFGDKDYAFILLFINGIVSPKEFTNSTVKTINKEIIGNLLGMIISAEQEYLNYNKNNFKDGAF